MLPPVSFHRKDTVMGVITVSGSKSAKILELAVEARLAAGGGKGRSKYSVSIISSSSRTRASREASIGGEADED